jgi:hypothetical protein
MPFAMIDPITGDVALVTPGRGKIVFHDPTLNVLPAIDELHNQGANVCVIYEGKSELIDCRQRGGDETANQL